MMVTFAYACMHAYTHMMIITITIFRMLLHSYALTKSWSSDLAMLERYIQKSQVSATIGALALECPALLVVIL